MTKPMTARRRALEDQCAGAAIQHIRTQQLAGEYPAADARHDMDLLLDGILDRRTPREGN